MQGIKDIVRRMSAGLYLLEDVEYTLNSRFSDFFDIVLDIPVKEVEYKYDLHFQKTYIKLDSVIKGMAETGNCLKFAELLSTWLDFINVCGRVYSSLEKKNLFEKSDYVKTFEDFKKICVVNQVDIIKLVHFYVVRGECLRIYETMETSLHKYKVLSDILLVGETEVEDDISELYSVRECDETEMSSVNLDSLNVLAVISLVTEHLDTSENIRDGLKGMAKVFTEILDCQVLSARTDDKFMYTVYRVRTVEYDKASRLIDKCLVLRLRNQEKYFYKICLVSKNKGVSDTLDIVLKWVGSKYIE